MKRRGVAVAPAHPVYSPTFRESTLSSAARLGFDAVRFNPGVGNLVAGTTRGEVITNWAVFDAHVQRCKQLGRDILLTMDPPDSGMAEGWESERSESPRLFEFNPSDIPALVDLYSQIVGRALVANEFPAAKFFIEIANEASLAWDGGVYSTNPARPNTGEIQPDYLSALGAVANSLTASFPDVALLSHAFSFLDPDTVEPMENPWKTEFERFGGSPPSHLQTCDIVNVHIYYSYKFRYRILTWDEYRQRVVGLLDDFVAMLRSHQGAAWDVVNRKPIWISEFGVSYNFAGLDEIPGQKWGNSTELATFRVATYDALANHPDVDACFYYTMRNELAAYDERDHDFNEGILLNGDADLPISYTPSYALFGYSNGVDEPEVPIEYAPAPEPALAGV